MKADGLWRLLNKRHLQKRKCAQAHVCWRFKHVYFIVILNFNNRNSITVWLQTLTWSSAHVHYRSDHWTKEKAAHQMSSEFFHLQKEYLERCTLQWGKRSNKAWRVKPPEPDVVECCWHVSRCNEVHRGSGRNIKTVRKQKTAHRRDVRRWICRKGWLRLYVVTLLSDSVCYCMCLKSACFLYACLFPLS